MFKKLLVSIIICCFAIYFNKDRLDKIFQTRQDENGTYLFTSQELKQYDGIDKPELFLVILGNVYNVTKGAEHYGPAKTYHSFIGQDASRCFVTGKFDEVSDNVIDLNQQDLRSLNHWVKFYKEEYPPRIGKLIGTYYDENGKLTDYGKQVQLLIKNAERKHEDEEMEKSMCPPCNVEWDVKSGSRVWCTKKSGGIAREWVGVPRQLYEPGHESYRCACIHEHNKCLGHLKEYNNCPYDAHECYVNN